MRRGALWVSRILWPEVKRVALAVMWRLARLLLGLLAPVKLVLNWRLYGCVRDSDGRVVYQPPLLVRLSDCIRTGNNRNTFTITAESISILCTIILVSKVIVISELVCRKMQPKSFVDAVTRIVLSWITF